MNKKEILNIIETWIRYARETNNKKIKSFWMLLDYADGFLSYTKTEETKIKVFKFLETLNQKKENVKQVRRFLSL